MTRPNMPPGMSGPTMSGEAFKTWRNDAGLTQARCALWFDVTRATINVWEQLGPPRVVELAIPEVSRLAAASPDSSPYARGPHRKKRLPAPVAAAPTPAGAAAS